MALARRRKFEHSDDVYTNAWKLCLGGKSGLEARGGGMECLGGISRDRLSAGRTIGYGYLF